MRGSNSSSRGVSSRDLLTKRLCSEWRGPQKSHDLYHIILIHSSVVGYLYTMNIFSAIRKEVVLFVGKCMQPELIQAL